MKKFTALFCCLMGIGALVFSQTPATKAIALEIHNVAVGSGTVYVSVSIGEGSYKAEKPDLTFEFAPASSILRQTITLPAGECVVNVYQDANNNGKLDAGFLGIPKEPVGISNWNGKGPPGNYNKHRININDISTATIHLHQL
jgi:uncharacterized protein (DUF2141 family)